jgi:biopolymer transport protein ExbB
MLSERLLELSLIGAEWVLWLLIALSLYSVAVLADRIILFTRTRERIVELEPILTRALGKGDLEAARSEVRRDSFVRNVIRAGLDAIAGGKRDPGTVEQAMLGAMARERARYEARLTPLGTIGNNAPFIGLFGTVLGIIQAFHQMGKMDASQAASNQVVMSAIGEALVATGVGIMVAIPAVAAFNWAKSSIAGRLKHAESLMRAVLSGLGNIECGDPVEPVEPAGQKA